MSPKRVDKKKKINFKGLTSEVSKKLDFNKIKVDPSNIIEQTKSKISNFYENFKKEREKEKQRLEKKRQITKNILRRCIILTSTIHCEVWSSPFILIKYILCTFSIAET